MEKVYEQFFQLKYFGGWSFIEAYSLPVQLRGWFVRRLSSQLEKENEEVEKAKNGKKGGGGSYPAMKMPHNPS